VLDREKIYLSKKINESRQEKCCFEASMKKDIWNFDHGISEDLKTFLRMFN